MENNIFEYLTAIAIQIGAILFLIFGVRTLFRLYNYNMKMYIFYNAKADALEMKSEFDEDKTEKFTALSDAMTPKDISLDKMPEHPYKELINLSRRVIEKQVGLEPNGQVKKKSSQR